MMRSLDPCNPLNIANKRQCKVNAFHNRKNAPTLVASNYLKDTY